MCRAREFAGSIPMPRTTKSNSFSGGGLSWRDDFAVQGEDLDMEYLKRWAAQLGVSAELDDLISGKLHPKTT